MNDNVKAAILALAERNKGQLKAEIVVDAAKDRSSPLHAEFPWDDKDAAHQHRLLIARQLIRSVRIEVTVTELSAPKRVPAFAFAPTRGAYALIDTLRNDPDECRASAIFEFAKAAAALRRARMIAIELGLGDQAVATVEALVRSVEQAGDTFAAS